MKTITTLLLLLASSQVSACYFGETYEIFQHDPQLSSDNSQILETPKVEIISVERGYNDDDPASCSGLGIITIQLSEEDTARLSSTGYTFKMIAGTLEGDQPIFPTAAIQPIQKKPGLYNNKTIKFIWMDGANKAQENINLAFSITAVNANGAQSDPQVITIENNGKTKR